MNRSFISKYSLVKGNPAEVTVSTTKASILGVLSATNLIDAILRVPKRIKKRKIGCSTDSYSIRTVTGRYLSFLEGYS